MDILTLRTLLNVGEARATAILGEGRVPLSFQALRVLVDQTGTALANLGIQRNARVAIVLTNGAEAAASFLAVACHRAAAPTNPADKPAAFELYLSDPNAAPTRPGRGRRDRGNARLHR